MLNKNAKFDLHNSAAPKAAIRAVIKMSKNILLDSFACLEMQTLDTLDQYHRCAQVSRHMREGHESSI